MTAIDNHLENYGYKGFSEALDLTASLFHLLKEGGRLYLPIALYEFHKICKMSNHLIETIRSAIAFDSDHLQNYYDFLRKIRDRHIHMAEQISDSKLLSFCFKNGIEDMLDEWDELVEECHIASDGEIKELFEQIATYA